MRKKTIALGMPYGTAMYRLRKELLFSLVKRLGLNKCHQCGSKIETADTLSIEHKVAWLNSGSPVQLFFDLENISFSHLLCNIRAGSRPTKVEGSKKINNRRNQAKRIAANKRRRARLREAGLPYT